MKKFRNNRQTRNISFQFILLTDFFLILLNGVFPWVIYEFYIIGKKKIIPLFSSVSSLFTKHCRCGSAFFLLEDEELPAISVGLPSSQLSFSLSSLFKSYKKKNDTIDLGILLIMIDYIKLLTVWIQLKWLNFIYF